MTIETRYDIGDTVWFLFSNKIETGDIVAVKTYTTREASYTHYNIGISYDKMANGIEKVFPSKEELLKSL